VVRAALGYDVDDTADRAPVFGSEAVVHHAEFLHRFLRRSRALNAARRVDKIRAVHRDFVAKRAHAAKGNLRRFILGERGAEAGAAGGDSGCQKSEIREQAPAGWEILDLLFSDTLADFRLRRLNDLLF